jgi:hypothetical protein
MALRIFEGSADEHYSKLVLDEFLEALTRVNVLYLLRHPETPELYKSGVYYVDPPATGGQDDDWQDIPTTLAMGYGDCDDLAPWRAAELRKQGIMALAVSRVVYDRKMSAKLDNHFYSCHALVQHPDGTMEDPTVILNRPQLKRKELLWTL